LLNQKPYYHEINELNEFSTDWMLKCLVSKKDDELRICKNDMRMLIVELRDEAKGMIEAIFWGGYAEHFFKLLTVGKIYSFKGGNIK
jgi:hypothetical protein